MWGGRGPSRRFICCCIPLIFFLTLFDCERGRRGRRGVASILLHDPLCPSFHFRGGGGETGKKRRGTDLFWPVRNYLTTLSLTLDALSLLSPSPSSFQRSFTPSLLISTTLLCASSLLPPLPPSSSPSSVAGATLSGTADRYVNWAGALTRTACKIILGAAKRQVIKLNFRPVDLIGTGN